MLFSSSFFSFFFFLLFFEFLLVLFISFLLKLSNLLLLGIKVLLLLDLFAEWILHFQVFLFKLVLKLHEFVFDLFFSVFWDLLDNSEAVFSLVYFRGFATSLADSCCVGVSSSSVLATTDEAATDVKGLVLASLVPHAGLDRHVRQHTLVIIVAGRLHRQHACHQRVGCSRILTYLCSLLSRHFEVLS